MRISISANQEEPMPSTNYTIGYNKPVQMLEFKHEGLSDDDNMLLGKLFNSFGYSLTNIIHDSYQFNLAVSRVSKYTCEGILYEGDIQYNEQITDILFLHGKYRYYRNHHPGFLSKKEFVLWQNAIRGVDKPTILKMLYEDKKISEAYLNKYSYYNPSSLYELGKYNLLDSFFGEGAIQAEKIDQLTLPESIKGDLKHSFSK